MLYPNFFRLHNLKRVVISVFVRWRSPSCAACNQCTGRAGRRHGVGGVQAYAAIDSGAPLDPEAFQQFLSDPVHDVGLPHPLQQTLPAPHPYIP